MNPSNINAATPVDVSGVRRSSNAEEGARRFFQTTNLIINHFKRDSDKNFIYKLTGTTNNLVNLLVGSSAVHLYHYLGIRTKSSEEELSNIQNSENLENAQKKELFNEFNSLLGQALQFEIDLSHIALQYEQQILDFLIAHNNVMDDKFILSLKDQIEEHLVSAMNKYPVVLFYDHIGDLTGLTDVVKQDILKETAGLKVTSLDLEKDLVKEEQGDKYIEISTLNRLVEKMKKDFEFKSMKDLKMETFPIRKILSKILTYQSNIYPISSRAIQAYRRACEVKMSFNRKFLASLQNPIEYSSFETNFIEDIITKIKEETKNGPQILVYWLQNLLETSFEDIYELLSRYGVIDLTSFCDLHRINHTAFEKEMRLFNISKMDLLALNRTENEFDLLEQKMNVMKKKNLVVCERSIREIIATQKVHEMNYLREACQELKIDYDHILNLYQKEMLLKGPLAQKYGFSWLNQFLYLFDLPDIYQNLGRFIYFSIFAKNCRQIARILETFIKTKEDKGLYLLGIKRILDIKEVEEWVPIKIEELMIERLKIRQNELTTIFNAENNAFLVNAFIVARLFDIPLNIATDQLKKERCTIYGDDIDLPLPQDTVSPVSYIIALDIVNRLKSGQEMKQTQKEQIQESNAEQREKQHDEIKKVQESSTLNWIEKKITATMVSVKSSNLNPTSLYWSEKDGKIAVENLKLHSELKDRKICTECGNDITQSPCVQHQMTKEKRASPLDLFCQYYIFALSRIQTLSSKVKIPPYQEIGPEILAWMNEAMNRRLRKEITAEDADKIIEGERIEVAKKIAQSIGEYLDKALYKIFKEQLKNA